MQICRVVALVVLYGTALVSATTPGRNNEPGLLEDPPLVVDISPCVSFQADDAAPLVSSRDGAVLGYVTVRSGAEPGAARRPDGSTLLRLDVSLLLTVVAAAGGVAGHGGGHRGLFLAQPRALARASHGPSSISKANIVAALSRRMPDACPSTVPASRVAAAVECGSVAGGGGADGGGAQHSSGHSGSAAGATSASFASLLVSVPTSLFRCGPGEVEEQFRSFFLQLAVDVSEQVCGPATQTVFAGALQNSLSTGCSYILVTAACKPATCAPDSGGANGTGGVGGGGTDHSGAAALQQPVPGGAGLPAAFATATATTTSVATVSVAAADLPAAAAPTKPAASTATAAAATAAAAAASTAAAAEPMLPLHGHGPALEHGDIDVAAAQRRAEEQRAAARSGGLVGGAALSLALCAYVYSSRWRRKRPSSGAASAAAVAAAEATAAAAAAAAAASTARAQLLQQRALSSRRRSSQCGAGYSGSGGSGGGGGARSPFPHMHMDGLDSDQASVASGCGSPAGWGSGRLPPLPPSRRASQSGVGSPAFPAAGAAAVGVGSGGSSCGMSASARRRLTHDGAISSWRDAALAACGSADLTGAAPASHCGSPAVAGAGGGSRLGSPAVSPLNPSLSQTLVPPPPRPPLHRFVSLGSRSLTSAVISSSNSMPTGLPMQMRGDVEGPSSSRGGSPAIVLDSDDSDDDDNDYTAASGGGASGNFHSLGGGGPGRMPFPHSNGARTTGGAVGSPAAPSVHAAARVPLPLPGPPGPHARASSTYGGGAAAVVGRDRQGRDSGVRPGAAGGRVSTASSPGWADCTASSSGAAGQRLSRLQQLSQQPEQQRRMGYSRGAACPTAAVDLMPPGFRSERASEGLGGGRPLLQAAAAVAGSEAHRRSRSSCGDEWPPPPSSLAAAAATGSVGSAGGRLRELGGSGEDDFEFPVAMPPELPPELEGDSGAEQQGCQGQGRPRPRQAVESDGLAGPVPAGSRATGAPMRLGSAPLKTSWSVDGVHPPQGPGVGGATCSRRGASTSSGGGGAGGCNSPRGLLQLPPPPPQPQLLLQQLRSSPCNVRGDGQTASDPLIRLQGRNSCGGGAGGAGSNSGGGNAPADWASGGPGMVGLQLQMGRRQSLCYGSGQLTPLPECVTLEGEEDQQADSDKPGSPAAGAAARRRRRGGGAVTAAMMGSVAGPPLMVCSAMSAGDDTDTELTEVGQGVEVPGSCDSLRGQGLHGRRGSGGGGSGGGTGAGPACGSAPPAPWSQRPDMAAWRLSTGGGGGGGGGSGGGSGFGSAASSGCSSGTSTPHPLIPPPPLTSGLMQLHQGIGSPSSFASAGSGGGGWGATGYPSPQQAPGSGQGPRALGSAGSTRSVGNSGGGGGGGGRYGGSCELPAARAPAQPTRLSRMLLNRDVDMDVAAEAGAGAVGGS